MVGQTSQSQVEPSSSESGRANDGRANISDCVLIVASPSTIVGAIAPVVILWWVRKSAEHWSSSCDSVGSKGSTSCDIAILWVRRVPQVGETFGPVVCGFESW
jgi:hypothetical protein